MKSSIRMKITAMVVIFSFTIICIAWLVCTFFMKGAFVLHVRDNLEIAYESCNELFSKNVEDNFEEGDLYGNITNPLGAIVFILNPENKKIYTSISDDGQMMDSLDYILKSVNAFSDDAQFEAGEYRIVETHDSITSADYYDLIGKLDNGYIIIVRTPMSQVQAVLGVVTQVFICVAAGLIVFGSIFILAFSNVFSQPIKNLSHVAKRMINLDFEVKVPVDTNDEIGELGTYMNEMSNKLEKTISELKKANLRLEKDIKEKEQIDDMRREFLSHVSHELKTPIALIQGYAEGLKANLFDDEESKNFYTDVIIDEAAKMNMLVKKLLNLNEIEFGNVPINIERFELVEFIQDIISASNILIEEVKAKVVFEEEGPCYVWADEYMIEEVVTNYLTNAIHYVAEGGIIKIYFMSVGNDIRVCVYNQGNNIEEEDIEKLFVKFYKADKARTREYGGNGIGLSIVAATMEAHGKHYGVFNVDDGVVFYFDLDANMPC